MIELVGLGAGGHAKVMIETLRAVGGFEIAGLLDANPGLRGSTVLDVTVAGDDALLDEFVARGIRHAFIGVGSVGATAVRRRLFDLVRSRGIDVVAVIHPSAVVSPSARLGSGVAIMAGAIVNAGAVLGDNVLVNTGSIVEHDCVVGDHVHLATGAKLGGGVRIGDGTHVGIGACVRQGIRVGANVVIGAGAAVVADTAADVMLVGVPARPIAERHA